MYCGPENFLEGNFSEVCPSKSTWQFASSVFSATCASVSTHIPSFWVLFRSIQFVDSTHASGAWTHINLQRSSLCCSVISCRRSVRAFAAVRSVPLTTLLEPPPSRLHLRSNSPCTLTQSPQLHNKWRNASSTRPTSVQHLKTACSPLLCAPY